MGAVGQQISLPLFIAAIGGSSGVYFILFFCSLMFNWVFWPITLFKWYHGSLDLKTAFAREIKSGYNIHWKLLLIGVADALNGLLVVYASVMDRTPGPLQAILGQAIVPITLFFSYFILKKRYTKGQYVGCALTMAGIIISLIPTFIKFETGKFAVYWPLIFLLGNIPGVLMNIYEEDVFQVTSKGFDVCYLLAWESLYQFITVLLFFWVDIVPGFGTSNNIGHWSKTIDDGFTCFFAPDLMPVLSPRCNYAALFGIIFTAAYCFSYIYGSLVMKHASANANAFATGTEFSKVIP
jgi:drug/metabolite transporter (DMT)-like permease